MRNAWKVTGSCTQKRWRRGAEVADVTRLGCRSSWRRHGCCNLMFPMHVQRSPRRAACAHFTMQEDAMVRKFTYLVLAGALFSATACDSTGPNDDARMNVRLSADNSMQLSA